MTDRPENLVKFADECIRGADERIRRHQEAIAFHVQGIEEEEMGRASWLRQRDIWLGELAIPTLPGREEPEDRTA